MSSAFLNAALGDFGLQAPRARNPRTRPQAVQDERTNGTRPAVDTVPQAPAGVIGDAAPHEQQPPAPPPNEEAARPRWVERGRNRYEVVLIFGTLALMALLWVFSAPQACPVAVDHVRAGQDWRGRPAARYRGETDMYVQAVRWYQFFDKRSSRAIPAHNTVATTAARELAQMTDNLATDASALGESFTATALQEASSIKYLQERLRRGRGQAGYFEGARWPWTLRLACLPCGYVARTRPCPDHPIVIARREAGEAMRVLLGLQNDHEELMKQHRGVQKGRLQPGIDVVCNTEAWYTEEDRIREKEEAGSRWSPTEPLYRDVLTTAHAVCSVTSRTLEKGTEFRDQEMSRVIGEFSTAVRAVNAISRDLENAYPDFSWSSEHFALGIRALDGLLGIVTALKLTA